MDGWAAAAVLAASAATVWLVVFALAAVATRPRAAEAQPAGLELGGTEPPAVAGFLCDGWRVPRAAIGATALDLVARGVLRIEDEGHEQYALGLTGKSDELTPYEGQVVDLVESKQRGGAVPVQALTLGDDDGAKAWWNRFDRGVRKDARSRGLSRNRWTVPLLVLLVGGAFVPSGLLWLAGTRHLDKYAPETSTSQSSRERTKEDPTGGLMQAGGFLLWMPLIGLVFASRQERDTAEGMTAAGRWLGLKANLHADGNFPDLPPTAVTLWDRYLAFAVALGVAQRSAHALPFAVESPTEAWSCVTGHWRLVHVRYRGSPFGASRSPIATVFSGLVRVAVPVLLVAFVSPTFVPDLRDVVEDQGSAWLLLLDAGLALVALGLAVTALRGLAMIVLGLSDVRRSRTVEGEVVRFRHTGGGENKAPTTWVAVDDGTTDEIYAWVVHDGGAPGQGNRVRAEVSPRLRYLRSITVTG